MIATYISSQNDCCLCQLSHGATAAEHLGGDYDSIDRAKPDDAAAEISDKLKLLPATAGKGQKGGRHVTPEDLGRALQRGATDKEIHDTVLIAAAFCMFNCYEDSLDTWPSDRPKRLSRDGTNHGPHRLRQHRPGKSSRGSLDSPKWR
jgi:alkylhydroperoxidase family enzyme